MLFVAKFAGSGLLVCLLFTKLELQIVLIALSFAKLELLVAAMALGFLFILIRAYKWFYFLKPYLTTSNFYNVYISYLYGLGVGIFTPGRIGEITRITNVHVKEWSGPGGLFFLDKFLDLVAVMGMALLGAYLLFPEKLSSFLFLGFGFLAVLLLFFMRRVHRVLEGRLKKIPFADKFHKLLKAIALVERKKLLVNAVLTVVSYVICIFEVYFILLAFGDIQFYDVLRIHPIVMLTNAIPVTIGGLGLREGTSVLLYSQLGVIKEHAFWAGFLVFAFNTLLYGTVGVLLINFVKKEKK